MYILSEKFRNKSDMICNLEYRNSGKNILMRKYLEKGILKHNPSSVKEWYNSIYSLEYNNYVKTLPLKDKFIYRLFDIYFNLDILKKYDDLSMDRIFIGKPEVKHFNNRIYITLYVFNKWIMRFYKMTNMMKTMKIMFSQKNKQFVMFENRPFLISTLLFKYPKFNQKLILLIKELLVKLLDNHNNETSTKIFNNVKLDKSLSLVNDINLSTEKALFNMHKSDEKVINEKELKVSKPDERYLYLYLCIVNYFFKNTGFSKIINILRKVLLCSSKENRTNNLKLMLEKTGEIYFTRLKINSINLFIGLINLFLMLNKILKSIYIMRWYKKNIYFSRYKFNVKNILILKNILNKVYNKKVEINIVNLKYLHLDGNILALAVVRKLRNRKRRVLRVIRMALRLSKKPYISKFYSDSLNINNLDTLFIKKNLNLSINNNIPLNKDLISKPVSYKSRIILYYLKHKIISGIKLQGTGRLTKRLTASRSVSKYMGKGSLKNRVSSYNGLSTIVLRGYVKSNLQYVNINSYNRIGAYGIKSWISSH